jgi:hypothetical protein
LDQESQLAWLCYGPNSQTSGDTTQPGRHKRFLLIRPFSAPTKEQAIAACPGWNK